MENNKRKVKCRRCGKKRMCTDHNPNYRIWCKVWHGGYRYVYGLWLCSECSKVRQEKLKEAKNS